MPISLSSVTTGDAIKPPRLVVYGGDGVGKTIADALEDCFSDLRGEAKP